MLQRFFGATLVVLVFIAPMARAQPQIEADDHHCAALGQMVTEAGKLRINARTRNPHGSENHSLRTFVSSARQCDFFDEEPTQWRVYAAGGEICQNLYICLPRPSFGPN